MKNTRSTDSRELAVSIVSHGHGACVQRLLEELARWSAAHIQRVVLTQNIPESPPQAPAQGWPFVLQVIKNTMPAGFAANHNRALADATEPFVCILNPDVALAGADPFAALLRMASREGVGCAFPSQVDASGRGQDFERELPTLAALWRRHGQGRADARVDWVNAACLVLPLSVWQRLGGFDARYFMYCEDVDLCLRLRLAGLQLVRAPAQIVHAGQRASHRNWRHFFWHLRSLVRLWQSPVYAQARKLGLR
jgi:GT2 family glycosyltransferase